MDLRVVTIVTRPHPEPTRRDLRVHPRDRHMDLTAARPVQRRRHRERREDLRLPMEDLLHIQVMKFDTCLEQSISGMKRVRIFDSTREHVLLFETKDFSLLFGVQFMSEN